MINKIIIVNKPKDYTSRDIVNIISKKLNTRKVGHTGTLDPMAKGVLVCLTGRYTKLVDLITSYDKEYIATIKLGIRTNTSDITGEIIEKKSFNVSDADIIKVFDEFPKTYVQTVPIYSAVKINGKKLYEYARENKEVLLPKREVNIKSLELLSFSGDEITFKTTVSKGTYIRSLIEDICNKLGTIGTMASLVRTKQGIFKIEDAISIDDINNFDIKGYSIQDYLDIKVIELNDDNFKIIDNGGIIKNNFDVDDLVLFTYLGNDIAIYYNEFNYLKQYCKLNVL